MNGDHLTVQEMVAFLSEQSGFSVLAFQISDRKVNFINQRMAKLLEINADDTPELEAGNVLCEDSMQFLENLLRKNISDSVLEKSLTFLTSSGKKISARSDIKIVKGADTAILKVYKTEWGELSDADFKTIVEDVNDVICRTDIEGNLIYINKKGISLSGYTREELLNMNYLDLIVPEQRLKAYKFYMNQMATDTPHTYFEFKGVDKHGGTRWIGQSVKLRKKEGVTVGVDAVARNITGQKETEKKLKVKNAFEKVIAEKSTQFIDLDINNFESEIEKLLAQFGAFFNVQALAIQMFGKPSDELLYYWLDEEFKTSCIITINQLSQKERNVLTEKLKNESVLEINRQNNNDALFPTVSEYLEKYHFITALFYPLKLEGKLIGTFSLLSDKPQDLGLKSSMFQIVGRIFIHLIERKKAEDKSRQLVEEVKSKNMELQDFAYMISHDLKAPIRGIGTLAEWIREDNAQKLNDTGKEYLKLMSERVNLIHNMIDSILHYAKVGYQNKEMTEKVDLNELVTQIIGYLEVPDNIQVEIASLPVIKCNRVQMEQVFQNLIYNAIKYMDKEKGKIKVYNEKDDEKYVFCVADNGPGIEKSYHKSIFKLFKTVDPQPKDECHGVGLAVTKKIIELNGGEIWVESTPGEGAAFYFTIPLNIQ